MYVPAAPAPMIATDLAFDRDMVTPRIGFTNYSTQYINSQYSSS